MATNQAASVYVGNLDEKVSEKVLYEILVQVGHVVHLHIPRDRETNRQKGFAFVEYESEEIANYAVRLFSGLVRLHNKTLKFAISGKDKSSQNSATPVTPQPNHLPLPNGSNPHPMHGWGAEVSRISAQSLVDCRVSSGTSSFPPAYPQASPEHFVKNGLNNNNNFEYNSRVLGATMKNVSRPGMQPIVYPSY